MSGPLTLYVINTAIVKYLLLFYYVYSIFYLPLLSRIGVHYRHVKFELYIVYRVYIGYR